MTHREVRSLFDCEDGRRYLLLTSDGGSGICRATVEKRGVAGFISQLRVEFVITEQGTLRSGPVDNIISLIEIDD